MEYGKKLSIIKVGTIIPQENRYELMLKQDWKYQDKPTKPKPGQIKSYNKEDRKMKVETQDLYFAVFCRLMGIELDSMSDFGKRKMFVFNDTKEYQKLKRAYYWNEAKVDPLEYKKGIRELKGLMMNT